MISLLCPTRGRPHKAQRMADSATETSVGEIEILFYVDEDDNSYNDFKAVRGPREGVGKAWNALAKKAKGDILAMVTDDCMFYTLGWDMHMALMTKNNYVAFPNDGVNQKCTFPFVPRKWYETLGYFVPEHFGFFYHDTWIGDVAGRLDRLVYVPNVHVTHWKITGDDTGREARARSKQDAQIWAETEPQRIEDAEMLRKAF